jgi:dethiobiotin synthetase
MSVFIIGTGTDVGKTIVSAWLCLHTNATYWKPIQTGSEDCTDTLVINTLTNSPILSEAYLLKAPLSPHAAAEKEGVAIDMQQLLKPTVHSLIIEGAGGVLVPINHEYSMVDLIKKLQAPVIVVAASGLGTINHTRLTLEALRARDIPILGVIMNGSNNISNKQAIEQYGKTQVLAEFPEMKELTQQQLLAYPLPDKLQKVLQENL